MNGNDVMSYIEKYSDELKDRFIEKYEDEYYEFCCNEAEEWINASEDDRRGGDGPDD